MTAQLEFAITTAHALSRNDKVELLQFLSRDLQEADVLAANNTAFWMPVSLDKLVREAPVVYKIRNLAADFWPADEKADDFNAFVASQREKDRQGNS